MLRPARILIVLLTFISTMFSSNVVFGDAATPSYSGAAFYTENLSDGTKRVIDTNQNVFIVSTDNKYTYIGNAAEKIAKSKKSNGTCSESCFNNGNENLDTEDIQRLYADWEACPQSIKNKYHNDDEEYATYRVRTACQKNGKGSAEKKPDAKTQCKNAGNLWEDGKCKKTGDPCTKVYGNGVGTYVKVGNEWKCKLTECKGAGYGIDKSDNGYSCTIIGSKKEEQKKEESKKKQPSSADGIIVKGMYTQPDTVCQKVCGKSSKCELHSYSGWSNTVYCPGQGTKWVDNNGNLIDSNENSKPAETNTQKPAAAEQPKKAEPKKEEPKKAEPKKEEPKKEKSASTEYKTTTDNSYKDLTTIKSDALKRASERHSGFDCKQTTATMVECTNEQKHEKVSVPFANIYNTQEAFDAAENSGKSKQPSENNNKNDDESKYDEAKYIAIADFENNGVASVTAAEKMIQDSKYINNIVPPCTNDVNADRPYVQCDNKDPKLKPYRFYFMSLGPKTSDSPDAQQGNANDTEDQQKLKQEFEADVQKIIETYNTKKTTVGNNASAEQPSESDKPAEEPPAEDKK